MGEGAAVTAAGAKNPMKKRDGQGECLITCVIKRTKKTSAAPPGIPMAPQVSPGLPKDPGAPQAPPQGPQGVLPQS